MQTTIDDNVIIRLIFTYDREIILFEIKDKIIMYKDRKWPKGFQFMPEEPNIIKAIILSRNKIRYDMIKWIKDSNSGKNLEEYNNANTDDELAEIVIRDAKLKGCVLRKKMLIRITEEGKEEIIK